MKHMTWVAGGLLLGAALGGAPRWEFQEKSTVKDTYTFAPGTRDLEVAVDNIEGAIVVAGSRERSVVLIGNRWDRAESQAKLELAKEEVQLRLNRRDSSYEAYVDAPWRCREGRRENGQRDRGYRVRIDFELRVPDDARVFLRTVSDGDIRVGNLAGDFDVKNINGGISMSEVSGSGHAYALNGKVNIVFRSNPTRDSYFGSLNGDVDLFFLGNLAADLRLKTFNGEIYTDFPVTRLPAGPMTEETRGGKRVYKASKFFGVRVGAGGPEIKLEGFNGDIRIHEKVDIKER